MTSSDYIVRIDEVNDNKAFFESLLSFFAPIDVILTTWGKLPPEVLNCLSSFKARTSLLRRYFFYEINWHLNNQTVNSFIESLCTDLVLDKFTWGLRKGHIPLGLCRAWDDMDLNSSDFVEEAALFKWVEELKSKGIIISYEKITA